MGVFSTELIRSAFYEADDAISITDVDGNILVVNRKFRKLYGFRPEEDLTGKSMKLIRGGKTSSELYQEMWKEISANRIWRGDLVDQRVDGTELPVHLSVIPLFVGNQKSGYMGFARDRSSQVQIERQLLHANRLVVLGTIGAGLGHELNNPMASISLEAEYLKEVFEEKKGEGVNPETIARSADNILTGVERMQKVVEHLLAYVRKESAEEKEEINLQHLLNDSFIFLEKQFRNRNISVELNVPDDLFVYGVRNDLESVFHNLLTNSRDAFVKAKGEHWIKIESLVLKNRAKIEIRFTDNAGGIPFHQINQIFEPFYTTKKEGEGTGLGLSISRKILVEHGGNIHCRSEGNQTEFVIQLPLVSQNDSLTK